MLKLDPDNIADYLKGLNIFLDVDWDNVQASEVTENTNVNFVFEVTLNTPSYPKIFIKQAFDFVKIRPDFPAPLERQMYEKLTIDYLQKYWKDRIPQVIHYDSENDVLVITDVGTNAKLLADEIKGGNLHFEIAPDLGLMMRQLHLPTYNKEEYPVRDREANKEHINFIFDFRLRGAREVAPDETNKLFEKSATVTTSIIYGDWASKNVFVAGGKVRLVDFENLVRFDPAFDIGYALAHWSLDINKENRVEMANFFEEFEKAYSIDWNESEVTGILKRAANYTGGMMLHRLTGVKNTNRMEEYLGKEIPLIDIAKDMLSNPFIKPSEAVKSIKL